MTSYPIHRSKKKSGKTVSIKSETILSLGIWFQKKLYGLFESLRNFKEIVRVLWTDGSIKMEEKYIGT